MQKYKLIKNCFCCSFKTRDNREVENNCQQFLENQLFSIICFHYLNLLQLQFKFDFQIERYLIILLNQIRSVRTKKGLILLFDLDFLIAFVSLALASFQTVLLVFVSEYSLKSWF